MSLADEIRRIQLSDSSNKIQKVTVLFEQYRKYLGFVGKWENLFSSFENAVCEYIDTPSNLVPLATQVPNHANLFASIFGMAVVQGGSNIFYLSWSTPLREEDSSDVESRVVAIMRAAYVDGTVIDVLQLLKEMLPNKELQLFIGFYSQAVHSTPGKRIVPVVEEKPFEKEGLYLFCK